MKTITFSIFTFILLTFSLDIYAQNSETTMKPMIEDASVYIDTIEAHNYEIVRMEFDLVSASRPKETFRELHSDWTYSIWAFGDFRFEDIDITVYKDVNGKWEQVEKDNTSDNTAIVTFKPTSSGMYKIDVIAYKFKSDYTVGHYGLIIFHE